MCARAGPVEIYANVELLLRYSSIRPNEVDWLRAISISQTPDVLFHYLNLSSSCPNYHSKMKIRSSIINYAQQQKLPINKITIIRYGHSSHLRSAKYIVSQILQHFAVQWPAGALYYSENIRFCPISQRPWKVKIPNIKNFLADFDLRSFFSTFG